MAQYSLVSRHHSSRIHLLDIAVGALNPLASAQQCRTFTVQSSDKCKLHQCALLTVAVNGRRFWREGESAELECSIDVEREARAPHSRPHLRSKSHALDVLWTHDSARVSVDVGVGVGFGERNRHFPSLHFNRHSSTPLASVRPTERHESGALVSRLQLHALRVQHSGRYTCTIGLQSASMQLVVTVPAHKSPPPPPPALQMPLRAAAANDPLPNAVTAYAGHMRTSGELLSLLLFPSLLTVSLPLV